MRIELRQMHRSNGLIDDVVVWGSPDDYIQFADTVGQAINSNGPVVMKSESDISLEICKDETEEDLFTSLQNEKNEYLSMDEWNNRNLLRLCGNKSVLESLKVFLKDVSGRGEGYSYISEYSENHGYSRKSPEWRLHVEVT